MGAGWQIYGPSMGNFCPNRNSILGFNCFTCSEMLHDLASLNCDSELHVRTLGMLLLLSVFQLTRCHSAWIINL